MENKLQELYDQQSKLNDEISAIQERLSMVHAEIWGLEYAPKLKNKVKGIMSKLGLNANKINVNFDIHPDYGLEFFCRLDGKSTSGYKNFFQSNECENMKSAFLKEIRSMLSSYINELKSNDQEHLCTGRFTVKIDEDTIYQER